MVNIMMCPPDAKTICNAVMLGDDNPTLEGNFDEPINSTLLYLE
jgi:hypothetical protein